MLRPDGHSLRPDMQIHTGHARAAWTTLNQTSNIRTGSLRPDIQAEAEHFQTRSPGSDRSCLDGFSLERISEDIPASGRTSSQQSSKLRPDSLEPSIPDGPDTPPWTKQSPDMPPQTSSDQTKHPSSDWTGSASYQTSKVRRSDIQAQIGQLPAQAAQPKTGYPSADRTATASDWTSRLRRDRFRPDIPFRSRTMSEWTSRPRLERHSCRPNISTQTGHPNSDSAGLHRTATPRQPQAQTRHAASDWAASGPTSSEAFERHVGSDRTALDLGPDIPAQTRQRQTGHPSSDWTFHSRRAHISPTNVQTTGTDQNASDRTPKLRLGRHSLRPDIQGQTGHSNSYRTASDRTSKLRADSLRQHCSTRDIQAQTGQPQRPDIQTQTGRATTDRTASDQTGQLRPDIQAHTAQP